jgi:predicted permease
MMITGGEGSDRERFSKKVLYSTPMLSAYLSMLIVALGIDNVPEYVSQPLTMIGNITVPAALLIIGSSMSQLPLKAFMGNMTVYATTLFRLILLPLGVHLLCLALGFDAFVTNINTVVIAMPVATYGTILCLKYNRDTTLIAELTFITTLLSMVSIPMLVLLMRNYL